jgi:hypothetical protein
MHRDSQGMGASSQDIEALSGSNRASKTHP